MGVGGTARNGQPVTHWHPPAHRQLLALLDDVDARLGQLPCTTATAAGTDTTLGSLLRHHVDTIRAEVMRHGDRVRREAETAPITMVFTTASGDVKPSPLGRLFYVCVCTVCEEQAGTLEMPFYSHDARAAWCMAHQEGTGHSEWRSWETVR